MKNSLLLGFFVTFLSFEIHACYVNSNETPNFNLSNLGSFKTNANNQRITATVNPDRYETIFNSCHGNGSNLFQIQGTANLGISTTEAINLNGRRYFKITKSPSSIPANPAIIYIAFSVQDNQDTATPFAVNDSNTSYSMYRGTSDTRGIRLLNVSILVQGTNLTPGTYNISNIILGTFTGTSNSRSPSRPINILNLAYTINASTCTVENTNVNLPSMRFSDFSSKGA